MILYGSGALLLKVFETALAIGRIPKAYFTEPIEPSPPLPIPLLGPYDATYETETPIILAFLDNTHRRNLFRRIRHQLDNAIIHPTAQVDSSVRIGPGTFIGPRVRIGPGTTIGPLVVIQEEAIIGAGTSIAEGTSIGPACKVASGTIVGAYGYLGAGATIQPTADSPPLHIGEGTIIGPQTHISHICPPFSWASSKKSWPAP